MGCRRAKPDNLLWLLRRRLMLPDLLWPLIPAHFVVVGHVQIKDKRQCPLVGRKRSFALRITRARRPLPIGEGHSGSRQIEAVRIHHLDPRRHEILDELLLMPVLGIDFPHRAQL